MSMRTLDSLCDVSGGLCPGMIQYQALVDKGTLPCLDVINEAKTASSFLEQFIAGNHSEIIDSVCLGMLDDTALYNRLMMDFWISIQKQRRFMVQLPNTAVSLAMTAFVANTQPTTRIIEAVLSNEASKPRRLCLAACFVRDGFTCILESLAAQEELQAEPA